LSRFAAYAETQAGERRFDVRELLLGPARAAADSLDSSFGRSALVLGRR